MSLTTGTKDGILDESNECLMIQVEQIILLQTPTCLKRYFIVVIVDFDHQS